MNKLIEVKNIFYKYPADEEDTENKQTDVLRGVSLDVGEGEFIAILGHNGSGKSTLARMLNGLILPDNGTVLVDGMDTADDEHIFDIRSRVGLVLQNPDNQLVTSIVEEDVAFAPENLGIKPKEIRRRVDEALRAVDMYEHRRSAVHKLSGGQKQRVAIAGILAMEPEILILDEPTAGLDPGSGRNLIENLIKLRDKNGTTIIIVSHSMENTAKISDKIMVMNVGKCEMFGTPKEIFSQEERLSELSLGIPQITRIMKSLKQRGCAVRDDILTVNEAFVELISLLSRRENL